jgi:tetratricopeptide (TPR) repeat protein
MHFLARNHSQAIATCDRVIEQDATFSDAYRLKGASLRELGRFEDAIPVVEAAVRFSGGHPWTVSLKGMLAAAAGDESAALGVVQDLRERYERPTPPFFVPPLAIALVYSQLDAREPYFEWMERALEARDGWLTMLDSDPSYGRHRDDPRHAALVARVGIPEQRETKPASNG